MRRIGLMSAVLAAVVLLSSPVSAQKQKQPGRGGFGGVSLGQLATNEGVQKEIKMTEDQIKKVKDVTQEIRTKFRDKFADAGMDREKMQALFREIQTETDKAVTAALKPDQVKRIKQIELQVIGLRAFGREEVQKELKFTDKQKEEYTELSKEVTKDAAAIMEGISFRDREKFQEAQKKVQELNKKALDKFVSKLTADQQKTYKEMQGEKFDYKPTPPMRPRTDA
jgi:predicted translin family RNA/ssDNA-binding protein